MLAVLSAAQGSLCDVSLDAPPHLHDGRATVV